MMGPSPASSPESKKIVATDAVKQTCTLATSETHRYQAEWGNIIGCALPHELCISGSKVSTLISQKHVADSVPTLQLTMYRTDLYTQCTVGGKL